MKLSAALRAALKPAGTLRSLTKCVGFHQGREQFETHSGMSCHSRVASWPGARGAHWSQHRPLHAASWALSGPACAPPPPGSPSGGDLTSRVWSDTCSSAEGSGAFKQGSVSSREAGSPARGLGPHPVQGLDPTWAWGDPSSSLFP